MRDENVIEINSHMTVDSHIDLIKLLQEFIDQFSMTVE